MRLWYDLETYSPVPLAHGVFAYAEKAKILLEAWALDDGPVQVRDVAHEPRPAALDVALRDPTVTVTAHNSAFDRTILRTLEPALCPPVERWEDTMVMALEHSLPAALDKLCAVLGIPQDKAKLKEGKRLIKAFTSRQTSFDDWELFKDYAARDVEAMRVCYHAMPSWNWELPLWWLDQRINDRGITVDSELVKAALRAAQRLQKDAAARTRDETNGALQSTNQRAALLEHIRREFHVTLPDLRKATIAAFLDETPDLDPALIGLLERRMGAASVSTAKYKTLLGAVSADGRLRGTLQFCGASRTGRYSGRLFQPQNLPRRTLSDADLAAGIAAVKADCVDTVFADPAEVLRNTIRPCLIASAGKRLVVADLANIEGRVAAWLAGEEWLLAAFRAYDAGTGPDLYKLEYANAFGVPVAGVSKEQRFIGKILSLSMGYGGGVEAFTKMGRNLGLDIEGIAPVMRASIKHTVWSAALDAYHRRQPDTDLSETGWVFCEALKTLWRRSHPRIASYWRELEGAIQSVPVSCGRCTLDLIDGYLRIQLPSGRYLCYPEFADLSYKGMVNGKWVTIRSYGAKFFENITQAVARDILMHGMQQADAAGFEVLLSVHDELICEHATLTERELIACMTAVPPWAEGLPLAAAGFMGLRYNK